jgi:hypothetical protein
VWHRKDAKILALIMGGLQLGRSFCDMGSLQRVTVVLMSGVSAVG